MTRVFFALVFVLTLYSGVAWAAGQAERLAVVDVDRVFRESAPGRAGEAHLGQAREVLQKGMDDLIALYKGKEDTDEAKAAMRDVQATLERQFGAERLAIRQVLMASLESVVRAWFTANAQSSAIYAVAPAGSLFAYNPALDITDAIIREMNPEKPAFPPLPTVTVTANPQQTPGTDKASPAKPGKSGSAKSKSSQ